jgi:hypothetical protein
MDGLRSKHLIFSRSKIQPDKDLTNDTFNPCRYLEHNSDHVDHRVDHWRINQSTSRILTTDPYPILDARAL